MKTLNTVLDGKSGVQIYLQYNEPSNHVDVSFDDDLNITVYDTPALQIDQIYSDGIYIDTSVAEAFDTLFGLMDFDGELLLDSDGVFLTCMNNV